MFFFKSATFKAVAEENILHITCFYENFAEISQEQGQELKEKL
jgi:hypothetical protein